MHERTQREVVRKSDLEKAYSTINGVSTKTARRRLDDMMKAKLAVRVAEGKNAFISLEL